MRPRRRGNEGEAAVRYDVFQHDQGAKWWMLDTVEADSADDAILKAAMASHGSSRGKYLAYESTQDCAEMEIRV
jgi:hypothetical protein